MKVLAIAMLGVLAVLVVVAAWVAIPRSPPPSPAVAAGRSDVAVGHARHRRRPRLHRRPPKGEQRPDIAGPRPRRDLDHAHGRHEAHVLATTLSARPTGSGHGVTTFTKVVFSGTWAGADKTVMCKATRPADIRRLAVPGRPPRAGRAAGQGVVLVRRVRRGRADLRSPDGPRRVTYAVPPPKPTDPRWKHLRELATQTEATAEIYRLRWSAPIELRGRLSHLQHLGMPTRVEEERRHALLRPGHARRCLTARPAQAGAWQRPAPSKLRLTGSECGPTYGTILMRARNAFGASAFTIVDAALVPDPRDIIC